MGTKYSCKSCGYYTERINNLKKHKLTKKHLCNIEESIKIIAEKPNAFICNICGKEFSQKTNMYRHRKSHGGEQKNNEISELKNQKNNEIAKLKNQKNNEIAELKDQKNNEIAELKEQNKKLLEFVNNNKILKLEKQNKEHKSLSSIYLIRTREFLMKNECVYKIGKTSNKLCERLGNYGKGGEVVITLCVNDDIDTVERELIGIFVSKYTQRIDIGNEYFEGDYTQMMTDIINKIYKPIK